MSPHTSTEAVIARLEARNRTLTAGLLAVVATGLMGALAPDPSPGVAERIVAREIIIVDETGRERVVIGAPLPEPRLAGARSKRGDPVSGVLLFDSEGNERGGYVTGDGPSGGASLTLDEVGRASVSLSADARGTSGLTLSNHNQNSMILQVNPAGAFVTLREAGQITSVLPASAAPAPNPASPVQPGTAR